MTIRLFLLLALTAALTTATPSAQATDAALIERGERVVDQLFAGDYAPVEAQFTPQMKTALGESGLKTAITAVITQAGAFKQRTRSRVDARQGFRIAIVTCQMERAEVDVRVVYDGEMKIAGLQIVPAAPQAAYAPPPYATPAAFDEREVTVDAGGWPLPGTLAMPRGSGPVAGVVLIHGSGPSDRDESVGPNRPFKDLAWGLASRGIAVLRYEKRTRQHAARVAPLTTFTVREETVDDAVAAVKALQSSAGIARARVFVLGHSLGGMLAPRIAAADRSIAGLIIMAGAVKPLEESIMAQTRYLAELDGSISAAEQAQIDAVTVLAGQVRMLQPGDPAPRSPQFSAPTSYWLDLRGYDPPAVARTLPQPMLILQGERDYQVTMADLEAWRRVLAARQDVTIRSYPSLNHLFVPGSGPSSPAEYMTPQHVAETVIADIAAWVSRL